MNEKLPAVRKEVGIKELLKFSAVSRTVVTLILPTYSLLSSPITRNLKNSVSRPLVF